MKKKRTRLGIAISRSISIISGFFFVIGSINDFFGITQLIEENTEMLWGIIYVIGSFLVVWRKEILIIFLVSFAMFLIISYAQKKEMRDRQTRNLSWFDAQRRNTDYSGGEEYLYELKRFFKQKDIDFSWWAVTGVAGIGKTRLVIEALRDKDLANANVQWIRQFDDYREMALKERVDEILEQANQRSIIIAEDAQIYMDNIGLLIEYISGKTVFELGKHKIRLLLLIRMGEDEDLRDRYKQLASKTSDTTLKNNRFDDYGKELKLDKYREEDIKEIVKSYATKTKKKRREKKLTDEQTRELQTKTVQSLMSEKMDPKHMRPLFAMFIADALLAGKDPMSWNREDILEYAVIEREDEFLKLEARDIQRNDNFRIFEKIRGIICLSIIRNGVSLSELDDIKEDLEEELQHSSINLKDFLKEMQMIGSDDTIHISMPDILSEYYVLRSLVIEPDEDIVDWVMDQLCSSLKGALVFRQKTRQDFRYLYDEIEEELRKFYHVFFEKCGKDLTFSIINKLLIEQDLRDSNEILLSEAIENQIRNKANESNLSKLLFKMIDEPLEIEEKRICLAKLKRLSDKRPDNELIALVYSGGLLNMINYNSQIEEKRDCLVKLKCLAGEKPDNARIVLLYCRGLTNMIIDAPEMEEKRGYLTEQKHLSEEKADNADIKLQYCKGINNMIVNDPDIKEKRKYLAEMKLLKEENNADYMLQYSIGLYSLLFYTPEMEEKRSCLTELEHLSEEKADNSDIALYYCKGLHHLVFHASDMNEKRSALAELQRVAKKNADNVEIVSFFSNGLLKMIVEATENEEKRRYLADLKHLSEEKADNADIVINYCKGLYHVFAHTLDMGEERSLLADLKRLAEREAGDVGIVVYYSNAVLKLIYDVSGNEEKRKYLTELKRLSEENVENTEIVFFYCKGLLIMRQCDEEHYNDYIGELYKILSDKKTAQYIAKREPNIITYTRRELLIYEHEHGNDGIDIVLREVL